MGEFTDRLALIQVEARSPDGRIRGLVYGRQYVDVRFDDGAYRSYRESELAHQFEQLAAVLWSRYRRDYDEVTRAYRDFQEPWEEPEDVEFRERRAASTVRGRSERGWISASSRALVRWQVEVAPGAVGSLTESEFRAEVDSAVADILRRWQYQVIVLREEIYGIGVPSRLRPKPVEQPDG